MKKFLLLAFTLLILKGYSQQTLPVTDSIPANYGDLSAGFDIKGESEKEVGNKGNFSRYKIHFHITNTGRQAVILLHNPNGGFFSGNTASPDIARFNCSNATGARMTSKEFTLQAKPCIIDAMVDETDPSSGKTVQKRKPANIGFWIKPGETISSNSIVIVPLNEKPAVTVTFFPGNNTIAGTVMDTRTNNSLPGFTRLRNFSTGNYLNEQNGPLSCTAIDRDWAGAQWEMIPVSGSRYYLLRNRLKNNYLSTENSSLLSGNSRASSSIWLLEETGINTRIYVLRNAADNTLLVYQDGNIGTTASPRNQFTAQWIIEE